MLLFVLLCSFFNCLCWLCLNGMWWLPWTAGVGLVGLFLRLLLCLDHVWLVCGFNRLSVLFFWVGWFGGCCFCWFGCCPPLLALVVAVIGCLIVLALIVRVCIDGGLLLCLVIGLVVVIVVLLVVLWFGGCLCCDSFIMFSWMAFA